MFLDSTDRRQC